MPLTRPPGQVQTPLSWAEWAAGEFGVLREWLAGASVLDPTMGEGNLLEALIRMGLREGCSAAELPLDRLYGVELDPGMPQGFLSRIKRSYNLDFPQENIVRGDILFLDHEPRCDILFGNPPWATFADIPGPYKERLKPKYLEYGLLQKRGDALLGGSRIDLAALILAKAVKENLRELGKAVFFLPFSLFFGDGAHDSFRGLLSAGSRGDREGKGRSGFRVESLHDLKDEDAFPGIATRYGLAVMRKGESQSFPVSYIGRKDGMPVKRFAGPLGCEGTGPWLVGDSASADAFSGLEIRIPFGSQPRQGINTCGANDVFFFNERQDLPNGSCVLSNRNLRDVNLPVRFVHPLAASANFAEDNPVPRKWVFLPYRSDGRPLTPQQIDAEPLISAHLTSQRERLSSRKGVMIGSWLRRGYYWALLGVGPYSFSPYKILWEAYGRRTFLPRIFDGRWQANQALQGFLPFTDKDECSEVLRHLQDPKVEKLLLAMNSAGTMNWAQPGRVKRLLCR